MAAAKEAHAVYTKHLVPAAANLERRARFDRRNAPTRAATYAYPKEWYGCLPEQYGPAINAQWGLSVEEWWSKSTPDPAGVEPDHPKFYWTNIDSYEYWLSKSCCPNMQRWLRGGSRCRCHHSTMSARSPSDA